MRVTFPWRLGLKMQGVMILIILLVEAVILWGSYASRKNELIDLSSKEKIELFQDEENRQAFINNELREFTINIIGLVLIIVVVTGLGTGFAFHLLVGQHIGRLKKLNEETQQGNVQLYEESKIPKNELGDLIRTRDQMLTSISESNARMHMLGQMAATIAHEINTPLGVILSNAQLVKMLKEKGRLTEEGLESAILLIEKTCKRTAKIVEGIQSLSRDAYQDDFERVSARELVEDAIEFSKDRIERRNVSFEASLNFEDLDLSCRSQQVFQAIVNLINNAADAASSTDGKWVKIKAMTTNDHFIIEVHDSGDGIADEDREKILRPFHSTKNNGGGTGIGLGLTQKIMEHHNGKLDILKIDGHTCFALCFPIICDIKRAAV